MPGPKGLRNQQAAHERTDRRLMSRHADGSNVVGLANPSLADAVPLVNDRNRSISQGKNRQEHAREKNRQAVSLLNHR